MKFIQRLLVNHNIKFVMNADGDVVVHPSINIPDIIKDNFMTQVEEDNSITIFDTRR
jgi:hypothetical protein